MAMHLLHTLLLFSIESLAPIVREVSHQSMRPGKCPTGKGTKWDTDLRGASGDRDG